MEYGKQLWNRVSVAAYQWKDKKASSEDDVAPSVMADCWGPGNPGTAFVVLYPFGEILGVLYMWLLNIQSEGEQQQHRTNDQEQLLKFTADHQPYVFILGVPKLSCKCLKDDLFEVYF
ncbi:hypothetical protein ACLOJK_000346 [Asimina triloba]